MSLLYPKMTERPSRFRLNPNSPLAQSLVLFGGGAAAGTNYYHDSSGMGNHGTLTGYSGAGWSWDSSLRRPSLTVTSSAYVAAGSFSISSRPLCFSCWYKSSGSSCSLFGLVYSAAQPVFYPSYSGGSRSLWYQFGGTYRYFAGGAALLNTGTWNHLCLLAPGSVNNTRLWVNGIEVPPDVTVGSTSWNSIYGLFLGNNYQTTSGNVADFCVSRVDWSQYLKHTADPSNIDLRVGGVPLILPERIFWPVARVPTTATGLDRIIAGGRLNRQGILTGGLL